jgi:hypothetical protein
MTKESSSKYQTEQISNLACPVYTLNYLIRFINQYKWFFGPWFIAAGIFFGFFGFRMFRVALFIVVAIAVSGLLLFTCYYTFLNGDRQDWVTWVVIGACVSSGLLAGFLSGMLEKYAAAILAGWAGFLFGVILNETVIYLASAAWLFWVVNIISAVIFCALGFLFIDNAIVQSTSFIGAYMLNKGVGIMAGGFPNIYVLIKMIKANAISSINPLFYAYFAGIILMTIVFIVFQTKVWLRKKQEKDA